MQETLGLVSEVNLSVLGERALVRSNVKALHDDRLRSRRFA
jgi:hypothetical protein